MTAAPAPHPSSSLCAFHRDLPAIGNCDRCGNFACQQCLGLHGTLRLCTACVERGPSLPPMEGRARFARYALWMAGGLGLLVSLLVASVDEDAAASGEQLVLGLTLLGSSLLYLASFVVSIVLFCRFWHLAVRHASSRGVALKSPGWEVGYWFIPFLNLVHPFATARKMLAGSPRTKVVGAWQGMWIVGNMLSNVADRVDASGVSIAAALLVLGAAASGARVISDLTQALTAGTERPGP